MDFMSFSISCCFGN